MPLDGPSRGIPAFLDKAEEVVAGILLCVMSALIFLQVIMRYVFAAPLTWIDEIAIYCMVWLVYLGASVAVRDRAHIRMLSAVELLPARFARSAVVLSDVIWLVFNLVMVWQGLVLVHSMWVQPYTSAALGIPQKWPYLAIPVGFALMSLRLILLYARERKR